MRRDLGTPRRHRAGPARRSPARSVSRADTARPAGRQSVGPSVCPADPDRRLFGGADHRHEIFVPPLPIPTQTH